MNYRRLLFALILLFSFRPGGLLFAGDTASVKPVRHIIGLQSGLGGFLLGPYIPQSPSFSELNDSYSLRMKTCGSVVYDFRINRNIKKRLFFLGASVGYMDFEFQHKLDDYNYAGLASSSTTVFSPSVLKYDMNTISFGLHISSYRFFKNFCIYNQLGVSYVHIASQQSGKAFTGTTTSGGITEDPSHATPSNPDGWYNWESVSTQSHIDQPYLFDDYVTPYFNSGIGFRAGHFLPFAGFSISNFGAQFNPAFKMELGVKMIW